MVDYVVIDIETCPNNVEVAKNLGEEGQKKLLNPIDSKIVAIGIRAEGKNVIFCSDNEAEMLNNFWLELRNKRRGNPMVPIIGFNIVHYDLPFLVTRSFINNVPISPFTLKEIIDLREKISAYRYGETRGKLKEFAAIIGIERDAKEGKDVFDMWLNGDKKSLCEYLEKDLEITDSLYIRANALNITRIAKW